MPGICGIASPIITQQHQTLFLAMLKAQAYERCTTTETFGSPQVLMGCAEISLVLGQDDVPVPLKNPLQILAETVVREAGSYKG